MSITHSVSPRRPLSGLLLGLILCLVLPGAAGAAQTASTTFGANLSKVTPQSTATCLSFYLQPTCTLTTEADTLGGAGQSFIVPQGPGAHGTGTITAFNVAEGSATGPMQVLLLQALRDQSSGTVQCCTVVNATAPFTPAANAITTIPVSWATENDSAANADGVSAYDMMAISVSSGVSLPVSTQGGAYDRYWAPECAGTDGTQCGEGAGENRYVVTMSADWTPDAEPSTPTTLPLSPVTSATPSLKPDASSATDRQGKVSIPFTCSQADCSGTVSLQNFDAHKGANATRHSHRHMSYAKLSFSLAAGQTKRLRIRLDKAGRQLLAHRHSVLVWLSVVMRDGSTASWRLTLKR